MQFHLEGLTFDGGLTGATPYTIEPGLRGWLDGVGMRRDKLDRPAAHGAFTVQGYATGREISWSGLILTDSEAKQERARRALSGLLADGGTGQLVGDDWATLSAEVEMEEVSSEVIVPGSIASYRIALFAPDPVLYGDVNEFGAGEVAYQRGNYAAQPTFVVTGAAAGGYTITGPGGKRIVVTTPLVSGTPHTVSMAEGEVMAGSALGEISVFQPWTIGPGLPGVTHTISAGNLLVRVPDSYR